MATTTDSCRKRHISLVKANQEIADKVNGNLPVRITIEDVQNNGQFIKLLTALTQHISEDGMCQTVSCDLKGAKEHIKHEKMRWLQQLTLYTELKDLLLDQQIKFTESSTQLSSHQFYEAAAESVSIAEIEDYLDCHPEPGTSITLLGLQKEDISRRNPHQKYMHSLQQKLIPELEARLRKKCECVVSFHDSSAAGTESSSLMFAKASQLPALLGSEKQKSQEERKQLIKDKSARERQFRQYYQALMDTLTVLERLITEHRLQSKTESDTVTSEWLTGRCDAMCLKIRLLEMQLMCEIYYEDTVKALSSIKKELDVTIDKTQSELSQVEQSLKVYTAVGDSFDNIVREYTYLKDEIESKKWALREFKHSLNSSLPVS